MGSKKEMTCRTWAQKAVHKSPLMFANYCQGCTSALEGNLDETQLSS